MSENAILLDTERKLVQFYEAIETPDNVSQGYNKWANHGDYDRDFAILQHQGHVLAVNAIEKYYTGPVSPVSIVDVAAGTGRVGSELCKRGFQEVDAIDVSPGMLEEARKKNVYKNLICARFGVETLDIKEGTYDVLTCVGGIAEEHLPACAVEEMVRLIKSGGVVVIVGDAGSWKRLPEYSVKMNALIENLEKGGTIKILRKDFIDGYYEPNYEGILIVLQKS